MINLLLTVCMVQTPACFDATTKVTKHPFAPYQAHVVSQDMPSPQYRNQWRYIIDARKGFVPQTVLGANVCGAAVSYMDGAHGGMFMEVSPTWRLDMVPTDDATSRQFFEWVGNAECRIQNYKISYIGWMQTEILIWENW